MTDAEKVPDPGTAPQVREISVRGTIARALVGGPMVLSVVVGHVTGEFHPESWLTGLLAMPTAALLAHRWHTRHAPARLVVLTGPRGHLVTGAAFLVLWTTPFHSPPIAFLSDAAVLFFGGSMLLAAVRGYGGCEVLAVSNWLLARDDRVGCVLFDPLDRSPSRS